MPHDASSSEGGFQPSEMVLSVTFLATFAATSYAVARSIDAWPKDPLQESLLFAFLCIFGSLLWLSLSPGSLFGFSTGASSSEWLSRVVNYGSEVRGKPTRQGLCGLRNLGNTCYLNATIQCLSADQDIRKIYLESTQHSTDDDDDEYVDFAKRDLQFSENNPYSSNGAVTIEFADLLRRLWSNEYRLLPRQSSNLYSGRRNLNLRSICKRMRMIFFQFFLMFYMKI